MKQSESRLQKSGRQKMEAALRGKDQPQQLQVVSRFAARGTAPAKTVWLIGLSNATVAATARGRDRRCGGR